MKNDVLKRFVFRIRADKLSEATNLKTANRH
jgi:hypothetical protein